MSPAQAEADRVPRTTAYLAPDSRSARAYEAALRVLPGGNSRTTIHRVPYPPTMVSGRGACLVDADGEERLDFLGNYTALIHGHAHPTIVERVTSAVQRAASFSFPSVAETELATRIVERLPSAEKVRFANSGTEAVMVAIRLARAATGRDRIAKFEGCYHGSYDEARISESAAVSALGPVERPSSVGERGLSRGSRDAVVTLPYNRPDLAVPLIEERAADLAAVLVDPAPNRAGLAQGTPTFLQALREVCTRRGIVLVFDEVITYRVGPAGLQGRVGVAPDLTTLGKIIGGGFPVGAVAGRADLMDLLDARRPDSVAHGGTFNGNPVTMVAGSAALDLLTPETYERIEHLAKRLARGLESRLTSLGYPCQVAQVGSLFQVHLRADPVGDYRSLVADPAAGKRSADVAAALLARGVIRSPNGLGCISTPMTEADVDAFVDAAADAAPVVFAA